MSQPKSRVIWSSKIKLGSEQVTVPQKSPSQGSGTACKGFDDGRGIKFHINFDCKNKNGEFVVEKPNPKNLNILGQSDHSTIFNVDDTDDPEINEFLDNDEEITIPKYIDSSELEEPSISVCAKEVSHKICEIEKNRTELKEFSSDTKGTSKDISDSDATDNNGDNSDNVWRETEKYRFEQFIKYICPQCGKSCSGFCKWKQHTTKKHKLNTIEALNMTITPKGSHKCHDCNIELKNPTYSKSFSHQMTHLPYGQHCICVICSSGFYSRFNLIDHLRRSHTNLVKKVKTPDLTYQKYLRLRCPLCFEEQINERKNRLHLEEKHDYFNHVKSEITFLNNSATCNVCNQKLQSQEKYHVITHMFVHELYKPFTCELCNNYENNSKYQVVNHIKRVHFNQTAKRFICNHCGQTFRKKSDRSYHQKQHNVKEDKCKTCHRIFSNISRLVAHMTAAKHQ